MSLDRSELAKRLIVGSPSEWIKPFDIDKYIGNAPLIEKLWEEKQLALTENLDLKNKIRVLEVRTHEFELTNQKLHDALKHGRDKSKISLGLSGIATLLTGLGMNLITSDLQAKQSLFWTGVILIIVGSSIEGFTIVYTIKR